LRGIPKETTTVKSSPNAWEFYSYGRDGVGRKDRKLVVRLNIKWVVEGGRPKNFHWETEESGNQLEESYGFHCFMTDVEIFPLTPQQAAFVGAKSLTSNAEYGIYWGTDEDVTEIQHRFRM
jgi:hypothetical protein